MIRNARRGRIIQGEMPVKYHKKESTRLIIGFTIPIMDAARPEMMLLARPERNLLIFRKIPGDFLILIRRGLFNSARCKGRKDKSGVFVMGVLDFMGWKVIKENSIGKGIQAG